MENDNNVNGNLNDNSVLDALVLTREQWRSGIVKAVIFTLIAVIIFFVPVTVRGSTDVTFGISCWSRNCRSASSACICASMA